jgi:hypothetical protein
MNSRVARIVPAHNELVDLGNSDTPVLVFNLTRRGTDSLGC